MKKVQRLLKSTKGDAAVAEVVGAVLIFAILISLFTTFMLWYVPTTATANENAYQLNSMNSFSSLESQLHTGNPSVGDSITQNIPLGINGVPPFSPSVDTQISYSHDNASFSVQSSFQVNVNFTYLYNNKTLNETFNGAASASGQISGYGNTQFVLPVGYYIQDGILIRDTPQGSVVAGNGPLPVIAANNSGGLHISASSYDINGTDSSTSAVGTSLLNLQYANVNITEFKVGDEAVINGYEAIVNDINLTYFFYNITSDSFHDAIYNSFYQQYNSSTSSTVPLGVTSWNFSNLPMLANMSGNTIAISSVGTNISLEEFQTVFYTLNLLNL